MIGWLLLAGCLFTVLYELFIDEGRSEAVQGLAIIASIILLISIMGILFCRIDSKNAVIDYETTVNTYLNVKNDLTEIERAAYINKLVDASKGIERYKYWNDLFDPFFVDSVNTVKPLKEYLNNEVKPGN